MKTITKALPLWLAIAAVLCVLINLPSIRGFFTDHRTDTAMILSSVNEDETRYVSRVREVVEGRALMGNPILKEHQSRIAINGLVEWFTAGYAVLTHLDLPSAIFQTDILFSFLNIFLLLLWINAILESPLLTLAAFSLVWIDFFSFGSALLRESHPKSTMLLVNVYLCLLFLPRSDRTMLRILRGFLVGLMVYSYPYHWTVFLPLEVLLMLSTWRDHRSIKTALQHAASIFVPFAFTVLPFAIVNMQSRAADPLAWQDTIFRFGLIQTHLPVAPLLQLQLWMTILALAAGFFVFHGNRRHRLLILILLASAVAVASNIVTGQESEFQGHYGRFVLIFAYVGVFMLATMTLPKKTMTISAISLLLLACVLAMKEMPQLMARSSESIAAYDRSDEKIALDWLNANAPKNNVILAPNRLAMLIPAYTNDSVFMSNAARFFLATDKEITDRYLVFQTFFPQETDDPRGGTLSVFGNEGGSMYSRAKRTYQLTHLLSLKGFSKTIPDFIRHQELRKRIDDHLRKPDLKEIRTIIDRYELDFVATPNPLPIALKNLFTFEAKAGSFSIYRRMQN